MDIRYNLVSVYVLRPGAGGETHELLQIRRAAEDFMGGTWQTVAGCIEGAEKAWEAGLRELREETGLEPREYYQLDKVNVFYIASQDALVHGVGFCAIVDRAARVTLNAEHDAHRWIGRSTIDANVMWPGEREALADLCREILDNGPAKPFMRIEQFK